jgi:predicted DNA-binding transcriptional regulator YafY
MSINKNALIRYKTIDACLQNRYRKWTLDDLVEACSDALYDYEGIKKGVSLRTVQMDIQMMRSEKLGYSAPIVVIDKRFYTYEDPKYSITNIPLTTHDLSKLNEVVVILQQFKGFTHFQEVDGMIGRLQHKIFVGKHRQSAIIDFEKNELLQGLEHLTPLYEAIAQQKVIKIKYQSFKAKDSHSVIFHPQLLKEYRNRWFVLGIKETFPDDTTILALDRIHHFEVIPEKTFISSGLDASFFDDLIGVTKSKGMVSSKVVFCADRQSAPYIITKPIHSTQTVMEVRPDGSTVFEIEVLHNYELERELLGFGEQIEVLEPEALRSRIAERLQLASSRYTLK